MPKWVDFLVKPTKYSNYDISTTKRGSATPGLLYPVWYGLMNPGEIFRMNIRSLIRTNPTKAPLMGRFKVRFVTVVSNFKNYCVGLEGYRRSFDWRSFNLPCCQYIFYTDNTYQEGFNFANAAVCETSLMDYLGYQRGWMPTGQLYPNAIVGSSVNTSYIFKNAFTKLIYYDFYRNYLVNPQETHFPVILPHRPDASVTSLSGRVNMLSLSALDQMYEDIHKFCDGTNYKLEHLKYEPNYDNYSYVLNYLINPVEDFRFPDHYYNTSGCYHGGLVSTMFDPDINTQWLSTGNYSRLQAVRVNSHGTSSSEGGIYTEYTDIVKASSLYDFIMREIYNGGTYADHIYSQFGVSVRTDMNIPQIVHVYDSMVDFEDITSQSETDGAVVGEQFGVGRGYGQSSRFTIRNKDNNYAYAMTFMWITPMVDYATGVPFDGNITKFSDLYTPAFDNYSLQPRLQEQSNAGIITTDSEGNMVDYTTSGARLYSGNYDVNHVLGYQPAYSEYKTDINRVHGLFANQLSYWAIIRRIPKISSSSITDYNLVSSYVFNTPIGTTMSESDACMYEVPFSVVNEDNFFYQLRFDIVASRPMSKSVLPHVK